MEKNQINNEKLLELINGGRVFPTVTDDGKYRIQCPFCNTMITGNTKEECMKNYDTHSKICYTVVI